MNVHAHPLHPSARVRRSALFVVIATMAMGGSALYNTFTPQFADRMWAAGMLTTAFAVTMWIRNHTAPWWHVGRIVFVTACTIRAFAILPSTIAGLERMPGNLWLAMIHWVVTAWFAYEAWPTMFPRVWVVNGHRSGD